jgi:hypothetical protein
VNRHRILRLALALCLFGFGGWLLRGYVTDDTYIHLRYAQNLLNLGEFSFNPGEHTYGATSPLWIFGLVLLLKLGVAPLTATWLLGALSGLAVLLLMESILNRMTIAYYWKTAFLILAASDAWFLRWTYSGMETPLATFLLLILLWPLFCGRDRGWGLKREQLWKRYLVWGVGAGLAGLTRPEFLLVAPLALPWLLWFEYFRAVGGSSDRWRSRPHKPLVAAIGGWSLVVVPWLIYAWLAFGRIFPGTASAKSAAIQFAPEEWALSIVRSLTQLAAVQGPMWMATVFLVGLVLYKNQVWDGEERRETSRLKVGIPLLDGEEEPPSEAPLTPGSTPFSVWNPVALIGVSTTWAMVLLGGYAVKQVWIISRYVSPLAPIILLAMAVFAEWLMNGKRVVGLGRTMGKAAIYIGVGLTLVLNWSITGSQVVPHARKFPAGLEECYVGYGEWLMANTSEDAVVAALDIGALGYTSQRTVLDLMGLVSPEILAVGQEVGFQEMVTSGDWLQVGTDADSGRPDYFVDRSEESARWADRTVHGVRFELLDECSIEGLGLREAQVWNVALYRLVSTDSRTSDSAGG